MSSLNEATLIGRVGKDPEIKATSHGNRVANFSLATSKSWRDKSTGEKKENTQWHRIVVWGDGLVGIVEKYVKKGSQIFVRGEIQTRKWTDQAGVEKYSTEIVVQGFKAEIGLLGSRGGSSRDDDGGQQSNDAGGSYGVMDDDIPFAAEFR